MTLSKPSRRAPKPRKYIARKRRPAKVRKTSRGKMGRLADKLFSLIVRHPSVCHYHYATTNDVRRLDCTGGLQCAHIVSRRYRSTRWDFDNAVPMCAGGHRYFTGRQSEWDLFVERYLMTRAEYDNLRYVRALKPWDGDIEGVLVRLAARAVALGIPA